MTNLSMLDYVENFTVSKSLNDRMWKLNFTLDKDEAPAPMIGIRAFATDYNDVEHCLFVGFIPGAEYMRKSAGNKVSITAFDFLWYLTAQYVPKNWWEVYLHGDLDNQAVFDWLGGSNSLNVTGLELKLAALSFICTNEGTFIWGPRSTKMEAVDELCEKCEKFSMLIFEDVGGGVFQPMFYYMKYADIDTYLPAQVTFTNPSDYVTDLKINKNSMEDYNRVTVYGTNPITGDWYTKTEETAEVTAEEKKPIEYVFEDAKLTSQAKVDAKAAQIYAILNGISATTFVATLTNRYDLKILQKVKFVGYTDIPEINMRIIAISYQRVLNTDRVIINFTADQSFSNLHFLARYLKEDPIQTQQQVIKDVVTGLAGIEAGTVTAVSGNVATVELERSGNSIDARILV